MREVVSKIGLYAKLYWPIAAGLVVAAVVAYVFWPLLVAFVIGIGAAAKYLRKTPTPPLPELTATERRKNDEHLRNAHEEYEGLAKLAKKQADKSGAKAAVGADAAANTRRNMDAMSKAKARQALEESRAWLRNDDAKRKGKPNGLKSLVLVALLSSGTARADVEITESTTYASGWWMDDEEHREMAAWTVELKLLRAEVIPSLHAQVEKLELALDRLESANKVGSVRLSAEQIRSARAEADVAKLNVFYRKPAFVASGTTVVVTVVFVCILKWLVL